MTGTSVVSLLENSVSMERDWIVLGDMSKIELEVIELLNTGI